MQVNLTITNLPQIKSAFSKSPVSMVKNLNTAIKKTAIKIQGRSMQNAPVKTGFLRASHTTMFDNLRATIMPTAKYAIYVHEGTRYMSGRPFLLNAVKEEESDAQAYFEKAVQDTLDEIARAT